MYDIKKFITLGSPTKPLTVGKLVEELSKLPQDAQVVICGDDYAYIHMNRDNSVVNIDCEDLESEYADDDDTDIEDYYRAFENGLF